MSEAGRKGEKEKAEEGKGDGKIGRWKQIEGRERGTEERNSGKGRRKGNEKQKGRRRGMGRESGRGRGREEAEQREEDKEKDRRRLEKRDRTLPSTGSFLKWPQSPGMSVPHN